MRKSYISANFKSDISTVWDVVTNNEDYAWRSDLSKIIVVDDHHFTEITKDGYKTDFTITLKEPHSRYEFDMENKNIKGHWTGIFSVVKESGTRIDFTEELYIKNPMLELMSYLFMNLNKIQARYVADLRKKLGE